MRFPSFLVAVAATGWEPHTADGTDIALVDGNSMGVIMMTRPLRIYEGPNTAVSCTGGSSDPISEIRSRWSGLMC
jgi:hypothetical protein